MKKVRAAVLAALVLGTTAGSASAQMTRFGQLFQSPGGSPVLQSVNTGKLSAYSVSPHMFELFAFDDVVGTFTGPVLWQMAVSNIPEYTHLDLNVPLPGNHMFAFFLGSGGLQMYHTTDYMAPGRALICEDMNCAVNQSAIGLNDINDFQLTWGSSTTTPEPLTLLLLGSGLAGIAGARLRRRRA